MKIAGKRRRLTLAVIVAAAMIVAVLAATRATLTPSDPDPTPESGAESSPSPAGSPAPGPTGPESLQGATNADTLPACDPSLVPTREPPTTPPPPAPGDVTLRLVGQLGGVAQAAALDGDRMFVGAGDRVVEVDLTDPRRPREASFSPVLPGQVEDVALAGDLLVVTTGDGGMAVLDRPRGLAIVSSLALPGHAEAVAVDGPRAFVADGPGGLRVVDLRDPAAPVEVAALFDLHRIMDVAVVQGRAYLAAADEGLFIVDVRDPSAPRPLGTLFTGGYAFGVAVTGARVLLADGWGGLRVVDVADPAAPRLVATVPTMAWTMAIEVEGVRAYVASGAEGLEILDLADPDDPKRAGGLSLTFGHAVGVAAQGDRAVLVDGAGVRIVDVAGRALLELSAYAPLAQANGLAVVGDRAFVAAKGQGLRVIDVSDAARPRDVEAIRTDDLVMGVTAVGSKVFFGTWPRPRSRWVSSIFSVDAAVPDRIIPTAPLAGPAPWLGVATIGSTALVAAEQGTWLIDASGAALCSLGYLATARFPAEGFESNGVTVSGDLAYIAPYAKGKAIQVADISDPRAPKLIGEARAGDGVGVLKVLAIGRTLYAIENRPEGQAVAVLDLARPAEPALRGTVRLPAATATGDEAGPHLAYEEGHLFVADASGGLVVIDVADPRSPKVAGRIRLPGDAVGVVVEGRHVYVASDGGGFFVVEWSPAGTSTSPVVPRALRHHLPELTGSAQTAAQCLVTTAGDDGPGSLRDCLGRAQAGTVVTFDPAVFPPDRPATVRTRSPLHVPTAVTIDGTGAGVVLDGGGDVDHSGLRVQDQAVVRALTVIGFGTGIYVDGSRNTIARNVVSANRDEGISIQGPDNRVVGNIVGPDSSGRRIRGAQGVGVFVADVGNVVGGPAGADRNVISGNDLEIYLKEARRTIIQGNYIGTDTRGEVALRSLNAQAAIGVWVGSSATRIVGNVVVGGINVLDPGSSYNAILGNLIDLDATGSRSLGEGGGIVVSEPFNRVGGTPPGEGNVFSGGIVVAASDVVVLGNRLGLEAVDPLRGEGAIVVERRGSTVGGRSPTAANVIFGDIRVRADSTLIIGNRIRAKEEDDAAGIRIEGAGATHVVANVVDGGAVGIHLADGAHDNVVRGNVIRRSQTAVVLDPASEGNFVTGNVVEP